MSDHEYQSEALEDGDDAPPQDSVEVFEQEPEPVDEDDVARAPIDGSVASLLEQAQEENASLQDELISLRGGCDALEAKVTTLTAENDLLTATVESVREELANATAREKSLSTLFNRLADLQVWTASFGRETLMILAPDMVEAAQTAVATGNTPDRVLLVPKPIIWPDYLIKP